MEDFNSLDWDDLKVFLHAARGGSLGSAAKRLRVDQSTISRRVAHLECTLGMALFERLPSGLRVNEAGNACCATPNGSKALLSRCARTCNAAAAGWRAACGWPPWRALPRSISRLASPACGSNTRT